MTWIPIQPPAGRSGHIYSTRIAARSPDGLTWTEVLAQVPHDGRAIFAYLLLAGFAYVVWRGSRGDSGSRTVDAGSAHGAGTGDDDPVAEPGTRERGS